MVKRQFPNPKDVFEYVQLKKPSFGGKERRLQDALTIADLRLIAKRRTPKAAFDYTDGAAEGELSILRARQAFEDIEFHPDILRPAEDVDTSTQILGGPSAMPFGIAPTGFTRLMQTEGETAGAGAAGAAGIPFTLSTLGTTSIEDVKAANPHGRNWFQLYVLRDREVSYGLVKRAAEAGFDTLHFTVDTPVAGNRMRDYRNGFSIPPQLTVKTVLDTLPRPWWWFDFLTTPKLEFASLKSTGGTVGDLIGQAMDPTISYEDLATIREMWPGKIVIKGVQNVPDAVKLIDLGVDGIVLSNHGGRQLDRAPIPFHLLPKVVREVGKDATVMIDTGIMNGADIVASVALGAKFTLIGRAYLYGLMAGGRAGVDRTIAILRSEIERTMKLLGVSSLEELEPRHVTQLTRVAPVSVAYGEAAEALAKAQPVRTPRATAASKPAAPKAPAKPRAKSAAAKTAAKPGTTPLEAAEQTSDTVGAAEEGLTPGR
ncbi:alpha-hydroxy-acid oxidizing protein [Microbacterium paludicola]|uniref:Alpha-hydroxy-acid oxidizing protein n=1 Tax=Microbacterium paludicola TaxID=300019 RepID=A0A4Y9FS00_9MICO|nr:alpha-hydroxy acid oxidase [Microbacterium paludicola]MBF0817482.1 alpha-hydroxy-acid oxidizing protein [Microbacterium paludicola]TFU31028.1 alpha-hydroxy-acid oxidizing protein [Microbacterium paludicola]